MTVTLLYTLKSRCVMPEAFFFLTMTLATCGSLQTLGLLFLFLQKKAIGISIRIALNLSIALGSMDTTVSLIFGHFFKKLNSKLSVEWRSPEAGRGEVGSGWWKGQTSRYKMNKVSGSNI